MLRCILLLLVCAPSAVSAQDALPVPGHHPAAFIAADGVGPRPLVIALHGNFDRPEWMCAWWAGVVRGRAFLLCPRGEPRTDAPELDRWQFPVATQVRREIAAARAALEARFEGRIAEGPPLYIGFSQGAHRVSRMAAARPDEFPRIQLVEGGATFWRGPGRYARSDGRVAFVCAVRWCELRGTRAAAALARGRAQARLERREGAHHDLRAMGPAIVETFEWLIEGDARYAGSEAGASAESPPDPAAASR